MACGAHTVVFLFKYTKSSYLQHQPQLVSTLHVFLVVHSVEFDHIGVVRKGFQDVVLSFDLLIDILENKNAESGFTSEQKTYKTFNVQLSMMPIKMRRLMPLRMNQGEG